MRWWTAAFEALYAGCHCGRLTMAADIEPMLTMEPLPCSTILRPKACEQFHTPVRLVSMTSLHSAGVTSRAGRWMHVPALLTRTSTRPRESTTAPTALPTAAGSVTSASNASAFTPSAHTSSMTGPQLGAERTSMAMSPPASASATASARPMPRFAPVTTHTLPSRRKRSRTPMAIPP